MNCFGFAGVGLNLDNEKPTTCLNAALKEMISDSGQIKREDLVAAFFNKFENLFEVFSGQGMSAACFAPVLFHWWCLIAVT